MWSLPNLPMSGRAAVRAAATEAGRCGERAQLGVGTLPRHPSPGSGSGWSARRWPAV